MTKPKRDPARTAALLSLVIFPGAGQIKLGRRWRGAIFILLTLVCLAGFTTQFAGPFERVVESHLSLDPSAERAEAGSLWGIVARWLLALAIVWAASVLDAYLVARRDPGPMARLKLNPRPDDPPPKKPTLPPPPTPKL